MEAVQTILAGKTRGMTEEIHFTLMREFFRRMALWTEALACPEEYPFGDLTARLGLQVDESAVAGSYIITEHPEHTAVMQKAIQSWLRWRFVLGTVPNPRGLPHPYEPFEEFLRLGGWFKRGQGQVIEFWEGGLSLGGRQLYLNQAPIWEKA